MNALEIRNVSKSFPDFQLDNLSLTLPGGCIMGLIGENGAGKSTTIKLILGMLRKDGGEVTIFGKDHLEEFKLTREDVGVVLDEAGIPECMTVKQVDKVMALIFRQWNSSVYEDLIKKMKLPQDKPFKDFSRGMKMKLGIAIALSHESRLLLLDEPTSGLDPVVRDEVVEMFREYVRDDNHSILISSHIVSDLEKLCDYIAFLHKGKLLLCEEKDRLLDEYCMVHCTPSEMQSIKDSSPEAIVYSRASAFGAEAIIQREVVPAGVNLSPISIEELFVFMVKEAG